MPQNRQLLNAFDHAELSTKNGHLEALNALIFIDPTKADDFRKAIIEHREFWDGLGNLKVVENQPNNDNFLALTGSPWGDGAIDQDAEDTFKIIHQLAAQKRVILGLEKTSAADIETIASAADKNVIRRLIADKDELGKLSSVQGWDAAGDEIITEDAAKAIQFEAQKLLLIQKIKAANDPQVPALKELLNAGDKSALVQAAKNLGVPAAVAEKMKTSLIRSVKMEVRLKQFALELQKQSDDDILSYGLIALNRIPDNFDNANDKNKAKAIWGERFLTTQFSKGGHLLTPTLIQIAASESPEDMKAHLMLNYAIVPRDSDYHHHAITNETLPQLRAAAAKGALLDKIAQSTDTATLKALSSATNIDGIKRVLEADNSFGFKDDAKFRDALIASSANDIKAAAFVRHNLLTATPAQLEELIAPTVEANFKRHFTTATTPANDMKVALTSFFNDSRNQNSVRRSAFMEVAKTKLRSLEDDELEDIIDAHSDAGMKAASKHIHDNAVNLFTTHNDTFSTKLKAYAAAELVVRTSKNLDFDALLAIVNDKDMRPLRPKEHQELISTLSKDEKTQLKVNLVNNLISKIDKKDSLSKLVQAKTIVEFNQALSDLKITDQTWVTQETMQSVQEAAQEKELGLQMDAYLPFGSKAHPEMLAVIKKLSSEKQKAILAAPAVLSTLSSAKSEDEIFRALNDRTIDVKRLKDENKRIDAFKKIENSAIASALALVTPAISLTASAVTEINKSIRSKSFADADYLATVSEIISKLPIPSTPGLYKAFGIDEYGNVTTSEIKQSIQDQQTHNANLLQYVNLRANPAANKDLLTHFLGLNKKLDFSQAQIASLIGDIKNSAKLSEFINKVEAHGCPYKDVFDPTLKQQITLEIFTEIKNGISKNNYLQAGIPANNNPEGLRAYEIQLKNDMQKLKAFEQEYNAMRDVDTQFQQELQNIGDMRALDWFNPAFQAAAQQNANKMATKFQELANGCDTITSQLRRQLKQLSDLKASLPNDTEIDAITAPIGALGDVGVDHRDALRKRHKKLDENISLVKKQLKTYEKAEKVLHGDPDATHPTLKKGVLTMLQEAQAGKGDIKLKRFKSSYNDYPISELNSHFEENHKGAGYKSDKPIGTSITNQDDISSTYYELTEKVETGKFREHTVAYTLPSGKEVEGTYIEERGKNIASRVGKGKTKEVEYTPDIKLTMNGFPKGGQGISPEDLASARVNYSMAMASQFLASRAKAPTADKPIILEGHEPTELGYIWTALVELGKDPAMKFDHKAIKVASTAFDPNSQMGFFGNKESIYNKHFKNDPNLKVMKETLKEINKNKLGSHAQDAREQITSDITKAQTVLKDNVKTIKKAQKGNEDFEQESPRLK